ncbi:gliding motility-associated C-terminal domain-containing protein [Duncaniella muris]|jgi:gliding motility-associated-like protein|uniref:gliding motility-associated C-terminal domain-containing protein n=2 Tax=Duncaniella muris TaxID=2094150 RepID=UPI0026773AE7|nr:gliding motility-associated C-terminal domain-containing protein [Duncaniella muris]
MRQILAVSFCLLAAAGMFGQPLWTGNISEVVRVEASSASGLEGVYVLDGLSGVSVSCQTTEEEAPSIRWYRYSSLGGGYAEELSDVRVDGASSVLTKIESDMGYIVEHPDGRRECFWVIDYNRHPFSLTSIVPSAERDCQRIALDVIGMGEEMAYYGINGRRFTLDRGIRLSYHTLTPDEEALMFHQTETAVDFASLPAVMRAPAPLCATEFTVEGDRFLRAWGHAEEFTSGSVEPYAVSGLTKITQNVRSADNEVAQNPSGTSFGGSAPCELEFEAAVTDGALFHEWQFSRYPEFDDVSLRIQDLNFAYTFNDEGVTYLRFVCANSDGSCEYTGEVYTVSIGASMLKCPNAFSPNGDGVNDEWKVSYSSLVSFECHIFDRYGHEITSFTDPSHGWDGKYKGKTVPSGAYFYVIKAKGSDGRNYELSGDINIVNYK